MRVIKALVITVVIVCVSIPYSLASSEGKPVTPYGDSCSNCGKYGTCKSLISHEDAKKAMTEYYHKKGLKIKIERSKGRFVKARVTESGQVVDVIIFDRKTGRIRSTY